jgi:hypothetical protein
MDDSIFTQVGCQSLNINTNVYIKKIKNKIIILKLTFQSCITNKIIDDF